MRLEQLTVALGYENPRALVQFAFGYFFPTDLSSYRGDYSLLAVNYTDPDSARILLRAQQENFDRGNWGGDGPPRLDEPQTVKWWVERLQRAEGEMFEGYKGGRFRMGPHTKVFAARDSGEHSQARIIRVSSDHERTVYFETAYDGD